MSLQDPVVRNALRDARTPTTRTVTLLDGSTVTVTRPFPSPADWRDCIIYFAMVDRFNNPLAPPRNLPYDARFGGFQGGTINGLREGLRYIKTLGAGAVWITPVFKNRLALDGSPNEGTYHGYGIHNFIEVDPRFGTEADLDAFIDEAHALGIYVIADIVVNHAGDEFTYDGHGAEAPFSSTPYDTIHWRDGVGNPVPGWRVAPGDLLGDPALTPDAAVWPQELLDNRYWRRQGSRLSGTEGDFLSLKELRTDFSEFSDAEGFIYPVRNALIRSYQYAVARFDFDGFRIDTLKHVERPFARVFGNAMREFAASIGKRNFLTFGEVFGSEEELATYTGRFASDPDDLIGVDAALDFPLSFTLPDVVKGQTGAAPSNLVGLYEHRKAVQRGGLGHGAVLSSHGEAGRFFCTFLDNHDRNSRFRFVQPSDPHRFDDQVAMGVGCLFGLQGIPVLYYGTELGFHGSGSSDQNVREAFWGAPNAFDTTDPFYRAVQSISAVRATQPALRYGRQYFRQVSGSGTDYGVSTTAPGIVAFSRILNDMEVIVVANTFTASGFAGFVVVDYALNPAASVLSLLYSNKGAAAAAPGPVQTRAAGTVTVHEIGGGEGHGPVRVVPITLQAMEIQILGHPFP
jgi:Glycosidases